MFPIHQPIGRRSLIRAGGLGLMGLGLANLLRARTRAASAASPRARSVLYLFQSGGPSQLETWDLKPDAPAEIRGEFQPIATNVSGLDICEHLPRLAARADRFSLVRTFSHASNDHSLGHHIMLTGHEDMPTGFDPNRPTGNDWPSIASLVQYAKPSARGGDGLPGSVVLPRLLVHKTGRVIPGQMAGRLDRRHEPWMLNVAPDCAGGYGACPNCFHFENLRFRHNGPDAFNPPGRDLPEGLTLDRLGHRADLLRRVDEARRTLDRSAVDDPADRFRLQALAILTSPQAALAFDLNREAPETLDRYGRNQFGRSLVMARRLIEAGVHLVQVNLGNDETWDTHQSLFPVLKEKLLPPLDQALSALLDDLEARGLLGETLIVMGGEFGRTPRISTLPGAKLAGRDHWGALQSLFFAGGGVPGGTVLGRSDAQAAYPRGRAYRPSDLSATILDALGIDPEFEYQDRLGRPFPASRGTSIRDWSA